MLTCYVFCINKYSYVESKEAEKSAIHKIVLQVFII